MVVVETETPEELLTHYENTLGPMVMAKQALEPEGRWEPLREQLADLYAAANETTDGTLRLEAEYLVSVITPTDHARRPRLAACAASSPSMPARTT